MTRLQWFGLQQMSPHPRPPTSPRSTATASVPPRQRPLPLPSPTAYNTAREWASPSVPVGTPPRQQNAAVAPSPLQGPREPPALPLRQAVHELTKGLASPRKHHHQCCALHSSDDVSERASRAWWSSQSRLARFCLTATHNGGGDAAKDCLQSSQGSVRRGGLQSPLIQEHRPDTDPRLRGATNVEINLSSAVDRTDRRV